MNALVSKIGLLLLLALTGQVSTGDSVHWLEHGFDYHLIKPVDQDYLARLIGDAAEGS